MCYKVIVIRSVVGNHCFELVNGDNHKVAYSNMFTRRENCFTSAKKLARALKGKIEYKDLESDYE